MDKQNSTVWNEFVKIAEKEGLITTNLNPDNKDFVGNPSKSPTGPFRDNGQMRKEYDKELYGVTKGTGSDLIEQAHPKTIQVADAMGAGGIVENQVEQQNKSIEISTKMPSGALHGVHAKLVEKLVQKANELEDKGKIKEAQRIDKAIKKILPFVNKPVIQKEAFWPALVLGLSALTGTALAANIGFFSSKREDLTTDLKDLYEVLNKSADDAPSAKEARNLLQPFLVKFQGLSFKNNEDIQEFKIQLDAFKPVLEQISNLIARIELELGESRWYEFGLDRPTRTKAKLEDVKTDIKFIEKRLQQISNIGKNVAGKKLLQMPESVSHIQQLLVNKGLLNEATGQMDGVTISAIKQLEKQIDKDLSSLGISASPKILVGNRLKIAPNKLEKMLSLIELAKTERQ